MNNAIECTLNKFANDIKLSGVVSMLKGRDASRGTLTDLRVMLVLISHRSTSEKWKVLQRYQGNPRDKFNLRVEWLESSPEEKDLEILVDEKHNTSE